MSSAFIPLIPDTHASSDAYQGATATAIPGGAPAAGQFAALLPGDSAAVTRAPRVEAVAVPPHAHDRLPVVTLKRQDDKVTRIHVRCSCGEVVELDCVY